MSFKKRNTCNIYRCREKNGQGNSKENGISFFHVPKESLSLWQELTPASKLTSKSYVCSRHFDENEIVKGVHMSDGFHEYQRWKLAPGALPKHFLMEHLVNPTSNSSRPVLQDLLQQTRTDSGRGVLSTKRIRKGKTEEPQHNIPEIVKQIEDPNKLPEAIKELSQRGDLIQPPCNGETNVFSINSPHEELLLVGGVNNSIPAGNTFPLAANDDGEANCNGHIETSVQRNDFIFPPEEQIADQQHPLRTECVATKNCGDISDSPVSELDMNRPNKELGWFGEMDDCVPTPNVSSITDNVPVIRDAAMTHEHQLRPIRKDNSPANSTLLKCDGHVISEANNRLTTSNNESKSNFVTNFQTFTSLVALVKIPEYWTWSYNRLQNTIFCSFTHILSHGSALIKTINILNDQKVAYYLNGRIIAPIELQSTFTCIEEISRLIFEFERSILCEGVEPSLQEVKVTARFAGIEVQSGVKVPARFAGVFDNGIFRSKNCLTLGGTKNSCVNCRKLKYSLRRKLKDDSKLNATGPKTYRGSLKTRSKQMKLDVSRRRIRSMESKAKDDSQLITTLRRKCCVLLQKDRRTGLSQELRNLPETVII